MPESSDVHGAGAQRSDPKSGSPTDYYLGVSCSDDGPATAGAPRATWSGSTTSCGSCATPEPGPSPCRPRSPTRQRILRTPPPSHSRLPHPAARRPTAMRGALITRFLASRSRSLSSRARTLRLLRFRTLPGGRERKLTFDVAEAVTVTSATKVGSPFRIKVLGTNFQSGCTATVGGVPVQVAYKNAGKIKLKHCKSLCPKGTPVAIVVTNPDGTASAPLPSRGDDRDQGRKRFGQILDLRAA